jgi:leucyl aminopeptidase (aminopeptidase T)
VRGVESSFDAVLLDCLGVKAGERVLVLTDPARLEVGRGLVERARAAGAEAVLAEMSERDNNASEPPPQVAAAMLACDVFIAPTTKSVSHTEARRVASERGVRAATMPGVDTEMLVRTMGADLDQLRRLSRALAVKLSEAETAHVTSPAGTDVKLALGGRDGIADDGDLRARGAFGNLPPGEGFIAPLEHRSEGRIVFDGSVWPLGLLEEPLEIEIHEGYATRFDGPDAARFRALLERWGRDAFAVAELGIGTNDAARLTGNILEDEKILGTVHVAFGDNHTIGGTTRVSSHNDGIVLDPVVRLDSAPVLERGRLLV